MAWRISGTYYAPCSCKVGCPCLLGELEGDQEGGWCSGIVALDIRNGESDGVDLGGTRAMLIADWPKGFLAGDGTGRIYVDERASDEQGRELVAILGGEKGGVFQEIGGLVPNVLDTKRAPIDIETSDETTRISVGDIGEAVLEPMKGSSGERTRLLHGAAAFRDDTNLARGTGTRFHDPDMREWESLGHGEFTDFEWSA
jgi:hypothetical protein